MIVSCLHWWITSFYSAFRLFWRGKKHEIASTSWSSCLWKLCELVLNIEEQLRTVFMYTGNLYHLHDLAIWKWHAFVFLSHHFFPMIYDWNRVFFFILVTLHLCLLLIHRYLWNSQKCQILISVNRDFDFFYFLRFVKFSSKEKVFKIHVDLNLQIFFSSIFICILGGICLSCLPLVIIIK